MISNLPLCAYFERSPHACVCHAASATQHATADPVANRPNILHVYILRPYGRRAGLTNLRELKLEGCEDITSVAALLGMRKLRTLSLKRCSALSYQKSPACVT